MIHLLELSHHCSLWIPLGSRLDPKAAGWGRRQAAESMPQARTSQGWQENAVLSRCGQVTGKHPKVISALGPTAGTIKITARDRGPGHSPFLPTMIPCGAVCFQLWTANTRHERASFCWAMAAERRLNLQWDLGRTSFCIIIPALLCDLVQVPAWRRRCCLLSQATRNLDSHISGCKIRANREKVGLGLIVCQMPPELT